VQCSPWAASAKSFKAAKEKEN